MLRGATPRSDSAWSAIRSRKIVRELSIGISVLTILIAVAAVPGISAQDLGGLGGASTGRKTPPKASGKTTSKKSVRKTPVKKTPPKTDSETSPVKGESTAGRKRGPSCGGAKFESEADRNGAYATSFAEGKKLVDDHDFRRGERALQQAIAARCDPAAFVQLGNLFVQEQRWAMAEGAFDDALRLDPKNVPALVGMSDVLIRPAFRSDLAERYANATKLARQAVFLDARSAVANKQLGLVLETSGQISRETRAYYEQATRLDPKSASAFALLSRVLRKNGQLKKADENLATAIGLATDHESKFEVAEVLHSIQRFTEAEQMVREGLKTDPKNLGALQLLARLLIRMQKRDDAEAVLKQSVEAGSGSIMPYIALGAFYIQGARLEDAEKLLTQASALALGRERLEVARQFELLGDAFTDASRIPDATRVFKQARSLDARARTRKLG